jgi:hypothetical protein
VRSGLREDLVDVVEATRPKEFAERDTLVQPRGERAFVGAGNPDAWPTTPPADTTPPNATPWGRDAHRY